METSQPTYDRDKDHLRLLSIFHYIVGGMIMLFSSIFIIYVIMGLVFVLISFVPPDPTMPDGQAPPAWFGLIFMTMGACFVSIGWVFGTLTIVSGRRLKQYRSRTFSLVVAGINCLWMPFGTALGVCTMIVLLRESVIKLYQEAEEAPPTQADAVTCTP